jgi:predicted ferric reductase
MWDLVGLRTQAISVRSGYHQIHGPLYQLRSLFLEASMRILSVEAMMETLGICMDYWKYHLYHPHLLSLPHPFSLHATQQWISTLTSFKPENACMNYKPRMSDCKRNNCRLNDNNANKGG